MWENKKFYRLISTKIATKFHTVFVNWSWTWISQLVFEIVTVTTYSTICLRTICKKHTYTHFFKTTLGFKNIIIIITIFRFQKQVLSIIFGLLFRESCSKFISNRLAAVAALYIYECLCLTFNLKISVCIFCQPIITTQGLK